MAARSKKVIFTCGEHRTLYIKWRAKKDSINMSELLRRLIDECMENDLEWNFGNAVES